jgi:type I restriction enzyme S subunit
LEQVVDPDRPITYGIVQPGPDIPGGVPYVRVVDIQNGTVLSSQLRRTSEDIARAYRRSAIVAGDLLVSIRGHVGRTAIVPTDAAGANLTQDTARIAVLPTTDSRYVRRCIESPVARRWLVQHTKGVAVTGINLGDLRRLPLPLPPLPEQRRIADILDKADSIRWKRKEGLVLTDALLRSAFFEMVGPGARDYASWTPAAIESLAAAEPNSMRTGPFGSDLRHSEFVDDGVAVLGIDNAVQNRFEWGERRFITSEKYEKLKRYKVRPFDVIVTIMGTTGRSAVVPVDIPLAITSKHIATITLARDRAEPEFVSQAIYRHPVVLEQIARANRGAIMAGLNLGLIRSLELPIPPIRLQQEFARTTARVRALQSNVKAAADAADSLFGSLCQRLFGELSSEAAAGMARLSKKAENVAC